jgi:hypothetical protein
MMFRTSLLLLLILSYASPALAAWGEAWGTLVWGLPISVPTLPGLGLIVLALAFSGSAAWMLRKRRGALSLPVPLASYARFAERLANSGQFDDAEKILNQAREVATKDNHRG